MFTCAEPAAVSEVNNASTYFVGGMVFLSIVMILLGLIVQGMQDETEDSVSPNYASVLVYFLNMCDLSTDAMFALIMLFKSESLYFMFSVVFVALPEVCSVLLLLVYAMRRRRVTSVGGKGDSLISTLLLAIFSVLASFPSALSLMQSRLFGSEIFSLPKNEIDHGKIVSWRFFNVLLCQVACK